MNKNKFILEFMYLLITSKLFALLLMFSSIISSSFALVIKCKSKTV